MKHALPSEVAAGVSAETYRAIGRALGSTVSVITGLDEQSGTGVGLTVSSLVTLSLDPPLVLFAVNKAAQSYPAIVGGGIFGVSVLSSHQGEVGRKFAVKSADKMSGTVTKLGRVLPIPLVAEALVHLECKTENVISAGDHSIIIGRVESAVVNEGQPLMYCARRYGTFAPAEN